MSQKDNKKSPKPIPVDDTVRRQDEPDSEVTGEDVSLVGQNIVVPKDRSRG